MCKYTKNISIKNKYAIEKKTHYGYAHRPTGDAYLSAHLIMSKGNGNVIGNDV